MFECRALMDPRVTADFSKTTKDTSLWEYNKKNLGEDRYLTAQLLEAGYGTTFEPRALSSTVAPDTLKGFIAQVYLLSFPPSFLLFISERLIMIAEEKMGQLHTRQPDRPHFCQQAVSVLAVGWQIYPPVGVELS